jgi:hypothetical protein
MNDGEILNKSHIEYPLYNGILYGDKISTAKFSKRLSCSIKHLPLRLKFHFVYDSIKAIESGITKEPSFMLNGEIFIEGLVQAEDITKAFEIYLKNNIG